MVRSESKLIFLKSNTRSNVLLCGSDKNPVLSGFPRIRGFLCWILLPCVIPLLWLLLRFFLSISQWRGTQTHICRFIDKLAACSPRAERAESPIAVEVSSVLQLHHDWRVATATATATKIATPSACLLYKKTSTREMGVEKQIYLRSNQLTREQWSNLWISD